MLLSPLALALPKFWMRSGLFLPSSVGVVSDVGDADFVAAAASVVGSFVGGTSGDGSF